MAVCVYVCARTVFITHTRMYVCASPQCSWWRYWPKCVLSSGRLCITSRPAFFQESCGSWIVPKTTNGPQLPVKKARSSLDIAGESPLHRTYVLRPRPGLKYPPTPAFWLRNVLRSWGGSHNYYSTKNLPGRSLETRLARGEIGTANSCC